MPTIEKSHVAFSFSMAVHKCLRQKRGGLRTLAALSDVLGRDRSNVGHLIRNGNPRLDTLERIADAFGMSLADFVAQGYYK